MTWYYSRQMILNIPAPCSRIGCSQQRPCNATNTAPGEVPSSSLPRPWEHTELLQHAHLVQIGPVFHQLATSDTEDVRLCPRHLLAHSDNCTKFSHRVLGFTREERSPAAIRRAISVALRLVTSGLIASTCFFITSVPFTLETGSIIMILPFGGSFTDTSVCFFK